MQIANIDGQQNTKLSDQHKTNTAYEPSLLRKSVAFLLNPGIGIMLGIGLAIYYIIMPYMQAGEGAIDTAIRLGISFGYVLLSIMVSFSLFRVLRATISCHRKHALTVWQAIVDASNIIGAGYFMYYMPMHVMQLW